MLLPTGCVAIVTARFRQRRLCFLIEHVAQAFEKQQREDELFVVASINRPTQERIILLFLNRTVRITGKNLRALGLALQERTVEFIKPLPERYSLLTSDDVSVKTIEIEDKKEQR
jgi:hypothetical protein